MNEITINELRYKGLRALKKALGPTGAIRFLQEMNYGFGDYTKERKEWLNNFSIDEIYNTIKENRKNSS